MNQHILLAASFLTLTVHKRSRNSGNEKLVIIQLFVNRMEDIGPRRLRGRAGLDEPGSLIRGFISSK